MPSEGKERAPPANFRTASRWSEHALTDSLTDSLTQAAAAAVAVAAAATAATRRCWAVCVCVCVVCTPTTTPILPTRRSLRSLPSRPAGAPRAGGTRVTSRNNNNNNNNNNSDENENNRKDDKEGRYYLLPLRPSESNNSTPPLPQPHAYARSDARAHAGDNETKRSETRKSSKK